ncbi:MAG: hypothetical protein IEMM0008_1627 [bacterium]|nr:MAG: hypothetical protein IEMM0008_1627 [bacterium]
MSEKSRNAERKEWFTTVKLLGDVISSVGIVLDISETGAKLWVDSSKIEIKKNFAIRLQFPDPSGGKRFMDMKVQRMWSEDSNGPYKQVGCRFEHLTKTHQKDLKEFLGYFGTHPLKSSKNRPDN